MAIQAIQHGWHVFQEQVENNWKVGAAALAVAATVTLVWGKFAALCAAAVVVAYCRYGEIKGIMLAASVVGMSIPSGIFATIAGGVVGLSLLVSEWRLSNIVSSIRKDKETLAASISESKIQLEELKTVVSKIDETADEKIALAHTLIQAPIPLQAERDTLKSHSITLQSQCSELRTRLQTVRDAPSIAVLEERQTAIEAKLDTLFEKITSKTAEERQLNTQLEQLLLGRVGHDSL